MKKLVTVFLTSLLSLCSCTFSMGGESLPISESDSDNFVHVENVSIQADKTTLVVGERTPYQVVITPSNADDPDYIITLSDESVVWVDETYLTGLKKGNAVVTVTTYDGDFTASLNMTVINEEDVDTSIHVESISLSVPKNIIEVDESMSFSITFEPSNATNKACSVTSSDTSIARIQGSHIIGVAEGNATITATSIDGSKTSSANIRVRSGSSAEGYVPDGYTLEWSDEFDGNSLNSSYWTPMIGNGHDYHIPGWGNNEEQYYKSENAVVSDGNLHIIAKRESVDTVYDEQNLHFNFTSARLRTMGKISTTYGYIEARIKLPAGTGLWPAFWMLPEQNFAGRGWPISGEIDIMEAKGRLPNKFGATTHSANSAGRDVYHFMDYYFPTGKDITGYHCYAVEWTLGRLKFYIDGLPFFTCNNSVFQNNNETYTSVSTGAPFDRSFHILLNLAIGGNYDENRSVDSSFEQAEMLVDFVRIYRAS